MQLAPCATICFINARIVPIPRLFLELNGRPHRMLNKRLYIYIYIYYIYDEKGQFTSIHYRKILALCFID